MSSGVISGLGDADGLCPAMCCSAASLASSGGGSVAAASVLTFASFVRPILDFVAVVSTGLGSAATVSM